MKRLLIVLLSISLHAATYYVSSAGNDGNTGSSGSPWLSLNHAVNAVACGDTINVVANGSTVPGDAFLPYFAGCSKITTVQSSALTQFKPIGWRTDPTRDAAAYGRLEMTSVGIQAKAEIHGSSQNSGNGFQCVIIGLTTNTITMGCNGAGLPILANGMQVEFEVLSEGHTLATAPTGFSLLTKYYVVNCSSSPACGANGSSFQLATTPGGTPLSGFSCSGWSSGTPGCTTDAVVFTAPLQVTAGSANIVMGDTPVTWGVNTPLAFSAVGFQDFGTLPSPLVKDTVYYITSLSAKTIQVSLTLGGPPVTITTNGVGPLVAANTNVPYQWAFRGLEFVDNGAGIFTFITLGGGAASDVVGVVNRMEFDRVYIHSIRGTSEVRGIAENGAYVNIHDSYIAGISAGESQTISGWASPGPTQITNNFLESAGEIILYGGVPTIAGTANAYKFITGNFGYKPPTWRFQSGIGPASGPCLYDNTDPLLTGGEWYTDTNTNQKYRCGSNGMWATTASTYPGYGGPLIKTGFEHKNGRHFTYSGNVGNYNWAQAQSGQWFNNNQEYGSGAGIANDNITIINNAFYNVFQFGIRGTACGVTLLVPCIYNAHDHVTTNNLVVTNPFTCGVGFATTGSLCGYHPYQGSTLGGDGVNPTPLAVQFRNSTEEHNTIYAADSGWPNSGYFPFPSLSLKPTLGAACTFGPTMNTGTYQNNIVPGDFQGECFANGGIVIASYYTHFTFSNNALLKGSSGSYGSPGATNTWSSTVYPATNSVIKYVNADGTINGDYHLAPTSPYSAANGSATRLSTDGTDLGADIDMIKMATSGAIAGTPPWDVQAGLQVNPGSTKLVFRYLAPTNAACTATIYNAPARISGNQVASVADSAPSSISDVLTRQLYISGLAASTHYWYKLACGGGVLMVGDFFTRAAGSGTYPFTFDWSSATAMQYSSSADMSSAVSLPAATRQFIPVASNSVLYVQVGTTGPISILVAP